MLIVGITEALLPKRIRRIAERSRSMFEERAKRKDGKKREKEGEVIFGTR